MDALFKRLYGSAEGDKRVHWSTDQVARLCQRYGAASAPVFAVPSAPPSLRFSEVVRETAPGSKTFTFTISTGSVDRQGDTINQYGWKTAAFTRNPVVLWAHDARSLPVGRATRVWLEGGRLKGTVRFAASAEGQEVQDLVETGFLKATSVGFAPLKFAFSTDPQRKYGIDFLEQELLEFSIVSVPANSEALLDPGQLGNGLTPAQLRRARDLDLIHARGNP